MTALESQIEELDLSLSQLAEVRDAMEERVREGLEHGGSELAALPTYLPPPGKGTAGEALVVDIGGTNLRAARVRLEAGGDVSFPAGQKSSRLWASWESAAGFFDRQADLALPLKTDSALPLGYCFSYPAQSMPDRDAVLLKWTKYLSVPGVVGKPVGKMLRAALLDRGITTGRVTVLNDTVAALMGGCWAYGAGEEFSDFIGLIVGTGTNLAAFFPVELISSQRVDDSYQPEYMAVNLEAGNFHPPHLSRIDDELDAFREDAGSQRMEKAVSGKFLPELFQFILQRRVGSPLPETKEIFRLAQQRLDSPEGKLASALVGRSADLVAACLAGLIKVLNPSGKVGILVEGSVIAKNPGYRKRVRERLAALIEGGIPAELFQLGNVNLIGAAIAALIE